MKLRKIVTVVEEIRTEGGREVNPPARVAVVAAVIETLGLDRVLSMTWHPASMRPRPMWERCWHLWCSKLSKGPRRPTARPRSSASTARSSMAPG
jgi:hypothetical protein